eukprot:6176354-Pleurochrysis_carterae.AAC.4
MLTCKAHAGGRHAHESAEGRVQDSCARLRDRLYARVATRAHAMVSCVRACLRVSFFASARMRAPVPPRI